MGVTALMRNGAPLQIRAAHPADLDGIAQLLRGLSAQSRYQRFLSASSRTEEYAARLFDANRTLDSVVATSAGNIIAVGSLHRTGACCAEFAIAVGDHAQGHGVGTLVLEALVDRGRALGLHRLTGEVLSTNHQMLDVLNHLGLAVDAVIDLEGNASVTSVSVDLDRDEGLRHAHEHRREVAEQEFLRPLFHPSGVVVVDAGAGVGPPRSTDTGTVCDTGGPVPVRHLRHEEGRAGMEAYAGAEVVVVTAAQDVAQVLREVRGTGVEAVVVTAGQPEGTGTDLRAAVQDAELAGIRVVGPGARLLVGSWCLAPAVLGTSLRPRASGVAVVGDGGRAVTLVKRLLHRGVDVHLALELGAANGLGVPETAAWMVHQGGVGIVLAASSRCPCDMVGPAGDVGTCGAPLVVSNSDGHGTRPSPHSMPSDRDLVELAVLHAGARWRGTTPRIALVTNDPWVVHAEINRLVPELAMLPADLTEHAERRIKLLVPGTTVRGAVLALRREVTASGVAEVLETLSVESGADVVVVAVRPTRHLRARQLDRVVQAVAHHQGGAQLVLVDDAGAADHGHHRRSDLPTFGDERTALVALGVCSAACSPQAR